MHIILYWLSTVDQEIFASLFFGVRIVRAFNFHCMALWRIASY